MLRSLFVRNLVLFSPLLLLLVACSDSSQTLRTTTTEDRFRRGMEALEDKDYREAQEAFNTIILQDPASDYADDAQYYLAESYFRDKDYKLAAFNYNRLRTSFPNSPFYKQAFFRSGEAYYYSSLSSDRDQRETKFAMDVFRAFGTYYADDSLSMVARDRIAELQNKLAEKDYKTAELYWQMQEYKAALVYYEKVMETYPGTDFYQLATLGRIKALQELNRRNEALDAARKFIDENPGSMLLGQVRQLQQELAR